jgi:hypothetical protein
VAAVLFKVDNPFIFPSGEGGEYSYWITDLGGVATLADAVTFADLYMSTLAASTPFKALFPSTQPFTVPRVSEVNQSTGVVIAAATGTATITPTGTPSIALPPQCAVVVSLGTAHAGPAHRGRMYFPAIVPADITATGRIDPTNVGQLLAAVNAAFAAAISGSAVLQLVVYSRVGRSTDPVLTLSVGDVVDTVRRRRDKLIENRQAAAL